MRPVRVLCCGASRLFGVRCAAAHAILMLLISFTMCVGAAPGPLPNGRFTALPNLPITYISHNSVLTVRNTTLVVGSGGASFDFYGVYTLNVAPQTTQLVQFSGAVVCAGGTSAQLLFTVTESTCAASTPISWFCQSAPSLYGGKFDFGISVDGDGVDVLVIGATSPNPGWGGAQWPFLFYCSNDDPTSCAFETLCNATTTVTNNFEIFGGSLNVTDSNVFINTPGTNATFEGNNINLINSNNITFLLNSTEWIIGMPKWCYINETDGTEYCFV